MIKNHKKLLKTLIATALFAVIGTHEIQEIINHNPPSVPAILFIGSAK
jgi:hypothetical protein